MPKKRTLNDILLRKFKKAKKLSSHRCPPLPLPPFNPIWNRFEGGGWAGMSEGSSNDSVEQMPRRATVADIPRVATAGLGLAIDWGRR